MVLAAPLPGSPTWTNISAEEIRVGKDVIELLTSGMYVSPITIYREYVQNSADAIDDARTRGLIGPRTRGRVTISFDHKERSVVIRDNGAGLCQAAVVPTLLSIGASSKRGTDARGFRGVGRLSGLAYCKELEFRTKAAGEDIISIVKWTARSMREQLRSSTGTGDLKQILADTVSVSREKTEDREGHFFEVKLIDIARLRSDILLNEKLVANYLSEVGPLPFRDDFALASEINKKLSQYRPIAPLDLRVGEDTIFRPFRDEVVFPNTAQSIHLHDVEFIEFPDVDGNVGALAWIAGHEYIRSIPPSLGVSGLRARAGDLQVGEPNLFEEVFKERRFNGWAVGEIHILDKRIVPNARRDNFEVNHHYYNLLVQLGPVAAKIAHNCRSSSIARNNTQVVLNALEEVEERLKQRRSFDRAELSRSKSILVRAEIKLKNVEDEELAAELGKRLTKAKNKLAKITPKRGASTVAFEEASALVSKIVTNREQAEKLKQALLRLCK